MTRLVLEVSQSQDLDLLLTLLKRLNIKVVQKIATTDQPLVQNSSQSAGESFTLNDFQDAMEMSDEEMALTFGEEYLLKNKWHPTHA